MKEKAIKKVISEERGRQWFKTYDTVYLINTRTNRNLKSWLAQTKVN